MAKFVWGDPAVQKKWWEYFGHGFADYTTVTGTVASTLYAQLQAGGQAAVANVQGQLQAMTASDQAGCCAAMQQMAAGASPNNWHNPWQNQYGEYDFEPQYPGQPDPYTQAAAGPVGWQGQGWQGQQQYGAQAGGATGGGATAADGSSMATLVSAVCTATAVNTPSGGSALVAAGLAAAALLYILLA